MMTTRSKLAFPKRLLPLLLVGLLLPKAVAAQATTGQAAVAPATAASRSMLVRGQVFSGRDSTTAIPGVELVFSDQSEGKMLTFRAVSKSSAGDYQVSVLSGRTYQIAINKDGKNIETQELMVPVATSSSATITKNFYISYVDTMQSAGPTLPAARPPQLPWPPPPSSANYVLPKTFMASMQRFSQVDDRLTAALRSANYETFGYYAIPGGFALVTQLEQIDNQGRPKPETVRWRNAITSTGRWQDWLRNLVIANNGRFRVLVFTVTPQPFSKATTTRQISQPAAEALLSKGLNVLPPELADQRCPPNCRVTVLVYEYTKAEGAAKSVFVKESSLPAETQLRNTHINLGR